VPSAAVSVIRVESMAAPAIDRMGGRLSLSKHTNNLHRAGWAALSRADGRPALFQARPGNRVVVNLYAGRVARITIGGRAAAHGCRGGRIQQLNTHFIDPTDAYIVNPVTGRMFVLEVGDSAVVAIVNAPAGMLETFSVDARTVLSSLRVAP
jgi:hypothetical protein